MRKEKHAPPFFRATSGVARFGKQFGCGHTPKFLLAAGPQKCLLGSSPNPLDFGTNCPKVPALCAYCLRPVAIAPGPYFPARPSRQADDQCSPLLPRPPAFAAGHPGILHKALSFVAPAHGGIFLVLQF